MSTPALPHPPITSRSNWLQARLDLLKKHYGEGLNLKQTAAAQVPQMPSFAVNVPLDIPAVNSGDEESEEDAEARRRAEEGVTQ